MTGNPNLQPQTFHTIGLQYRFSAGQSFYYLGLTSSVSNNRIIAYQNYDKVTGVTTSSPDNIGHSFQKGFSASLNTKFNKDWSMNVNGRVSYDVRQNDISNQVSIRNSGFSGYGNMNSSYTISKKIFNKFVYRILQKCGIPTNVIWYVIVLWCGD